jgi:hypothetical protein
VSKDLRFQQDGVEWVEKLARQDWSAFQNGDLGCILAVARKKLWDELTSECREIVECYEQEYLRRLAWMLETPAPADESGISQSVHKGFLLEKGTPDRVMFEIRFDTDLPAIYFCAADPYETSGVITLVLDEANEVRLCYRGALLSAGELAKILLAPVLFRVSVHNPKLNDDLVDIARIRGAYGEGSLVGRGRVQPRTKPNFSQAAREVVKTHSKRPAWLAALDITKPDWLRYALSGCAVLIATGLIFLFQSLTTVPIFWLLSGPIIFAFVQWGMGPGIFALFIAIFNTDYFFVEPLYEFNFGSTTRLLGLAYALMAFSAYWLSARRKSDLSV